MKKILKNVAIAIMIISTLILLTACIGENKLVATKDLTLENDGVEGTTTIEVTFKGDTPEKIELTMDLKDEEMANSIYTLFKSVLTMQSETSNEEKSNLEIIQDGNKVIFSTTEISDLIENEEINTKVKIQEYLQEEGYTVK